MKELAGTARNLSLVKDSQCPTIEVVLAVSEPTYRVDVTGTLVKQRDTIETLRFTSTPAGLRTLASDCITWAAEAEEFARGMTAAGSPAEKE